MGPQPAARERFAENLRDRRKQMGFSQEALAGMCGLDRTEISLLECSKRSPRLDTLVVLARALELASAGDLLGGVR